MFAPQNEINTRRLKIRAIAQRICDMEVSHAEDPSQFIPMHWKRCEQLENEDLKLIFVMKSVAEENGGAFCAECLNPCFPFLTPEDYQKLCQLAAEKKTLEGALCDLEDSVDFDWTTSPMPIQDWPEHFRKSMASRGDVIGNCIQRTERRLAEIQSDRFMLDNWYAIDLAMTSEAIAMWNKIRDKFLEIVTVEQLRQGQILLRQELDENGDSTPLEVESSSPAVSTSGPREECGNEDGPVEPDSWRLNGVVIAESMKSKSWKAVEYLWGCRHKRCYFEDLAFPIYGDDDYDVTGDAIPSIRKDVNSFFTRHEIPWRFAVRTESDKRRYAYLKPADSAV